MPATLSCPKCQAVLKSAQPVPAGKKVKCPKCGGVFVTPGAAAPAPAPAARAKPKVAAAAEPEDAGYEVIDEEPAPKPKRRPPADEETEVVDETATADQEEPDEDEDRPRKKKGQRKKKQSAGSSGLVLGLVIGGVVLLVLLAGGGGVAYWYLNRDVNKGTGTEDMLAYVPSNSKVIVGIKSGELLDDPVLGPKYERTIKGSIPDSGLEELNATGLSFRDLFDQVVLALVDAPTPQNPGRQQSIVIVRSRVPFSQKRVRDAFKDGEVIRFKGKTYFRPKNREDLVFMPSDRTIIFTDLPTAAAEPAIIGSDGTRVEIPDDTLTMIRAVQSNHAWVIPVMNEQMREQMKTGMNNPAAAMMPPDVKNAVTQLSGAKGFGLWGNLRGKQVELHVGARCASDAAAGQVATALQNFWNTQGKAMMGLAQLQLAQAPKSVGTLVQEFTQTAKFTSQGSTAELTCQVNATTLESLAGEARNFRPPAGAMPAGGPGMMPGPGMGRPGGRRGPG